MRRILSYEESLAAVRALSEHRAPKKFLRFTRPPVKRERRVVIHAPWLAKASNGEPGNPAAEFQTEERSGTHNAQHGNTPVDFGERTEVPQGEELEKL